MATAAERVVTAVDAERVARLTLDLCRIRSYTGDTQAATDAWLAVVRGMGLAIQVFDEFPGTPSVVATLPGSGGGRSLELNAHMDTIPLDHRPAEIAEGHVYGRGATDMKGGLAAATEAVRAIQAAGVRLKGDLIVSTHGLHELPGGHGEDLTARVARGIHGDAAIVTECGSDTLPVAGVGQALVEIMVRRDGEVTHENSTAPGTPHPIYAGARLVQLIEARHRELAATTNIPYAGPESFFVGEFQAGDFFNRFPVEARIVGTRRYAPGRRFEDVVAEVQALCDRVAAETGTHISLAMTKGRDGFLVDPADPLVVAVRDAYQAVTGQVLPLGGLRSVADASIFNQVGGIPALYHGPGGRGHHADEEAMPIAELERAARVLALTALTFCGVAD
ncbi:MAG: M20/M25/M40 family metallo-hydrolase [Chloroflexi bacterium]|nr:M20/M25/M40 family metallo-hydrolase [Chloroflexota bacterium]